MEKQVESWKERLPEDLTFDEFDDDAKFADGKHYKFGAWNADGVPWLAWNDEAGFCQQLAGLHD